MANDRISQLPVEVLILPTDALARTSQLPVEVLTLPTSAKARISQLAVEVLVFIGIPAAISNVRIPISKVTSSGARW